MLGVEAGWVSPCVLVCGSRAVIDFSPCVSITHVRAHSPVNRHVQDSLGMLQAIRQQGVSDRIKSDLFAKRRLGSQKKETGVFTISRFKCCHLMRMFVRLGLHCHCCVVFTPSEIPAKAPLLPDAETRNKLWAAGRAEGIAAFNQLVSADQAVALDTILQMSVPVVFQSSEGGASGAGASGAGASGAGASAEPRAPVAAHEPRRGSADAEPSVPAGQAHNCIMLTDDDPVDTDEEDVLALDLAEEHRIRTAAEASGGGSSGGSEQDVSDAAAFLVIAQSDARCAARGEPNGADLEGDSVRSIVSDAVRGSQAALEKAGFEFDGPDSVAPSADSASGVEAGGGGMAGVAPVAPKARVLPAGKMLVMGSTGLQEVWISHFLSLLSVNAKLSTDRLARITGAARAAAAKGVQASGVQHMVEWGATCAVRYQDSLYYGTVARYGYYTPKSGLTSELTIPVSIHPDHKASGISFWFVWFWEIPSVVHPDGSADGTGHEVAALVAAPKFTKSTADTLHTGECLPDAHTSTT